MNRKINLRSAVLVIIIIASTAALFLVLASNQLREKIQKSQESIADYQKKISRVATVNEEKNLTAASGGWKIVSGNADDICSIPVYEGTVRIRGWYVYDLNYEKKKEWLLRIADEDTNKLPLFEQNRNREDFHLRVKLEKISPETEDLLKKASAENPVEITITRYLAYCEGVSIASIKSAENI
jgi:type II secretory pathway pseudopilin PulG